MKHQMDAVLDFIIKNKENIINDIENDNTTEYFNDLIKELSLKYYKIYINDLNKQDFSKGHQDKDTKKKLKKFVVSDFKNIQLFIQNEIEEISEHYFNSDEIYQKKRKQLIALQKIETYEQRTPQWYAFRKKILTASDLASAFDKGHFISRDELILSKIEPQPWKGNPACEWGVKYEDIAIQVYEQRNNVEVLEFGLVPHPTIDIFGASPDGIVADTGNKELTSRMLEIKCPWQRKIKHGEVPWHYWAQIQGQLDSCDLDYCDFLQVKIVEYSCRKKYLVDTEQKEKGLIVSTWNKGQEHTGSPKYHYCPPNIPIEKQEEWLNPFFNENKYDIDNISYWKVALYSCFTVKRDKAWFTAIIPEIYRFHNDLKYWKEQGSQKLKEQINNNKKKQSNYSFQGYTGDYELKLPTECLL